MPNQGTTQRTQRSLFAAVASLANFGTRLFVRFLIAPFIVSGVGTAYFGLWEVCRQLMVQMSAAEGRSMQALKWTLANKQASNDISAKRMDVGSAIQVWAFFSPIIIIIGILLFWKVPSFLGDVDSEMIPVARLTIAILVVNFALSTLIKLPQAILVGENLEYKASRAEIIAIIIGNGGLMVLAVHLGFGVVGLAIAVVLTTLLTGILFFRVARRNVPWFGFVWPPIAHLRGFFNFSFWVMSWTGINKLILSTDLIILGYVGSLEVVTAYALTLYLILPGREIAAHLTQAAIPGLGGLVGESKFALARRVRVEIMSVSWILATVTGCVVIAWNKSLVSMWMGPEIYAGDVANLLMVLMTAQLMIYRNDQIIIDTTLRIQKKVAVGVVAAVATIGASLLLGVKYGIIGLLLGLIMGRAILSFAFPILVAIAFRTSPLGQFIDAVRPILVMLSLWAVVWASREWFFVEEWMTLIVGTLLTALVSGMAAIFLGLDSTRREWMLMRIAKFREV